MNTKRHETYGRYLCVDFDDGPLVEWLAEVRGGFFAEADSMLGRRSEWLGQDPETESRETFQTEVHKALIRGTDLLLAGLMAAAMKTFHFEDFKMQGRRLKSNIPTSLIADAIVQPINAYLTPWWPGYFLSTAGSQFDIAVGFSLYRHYATT